MSLGLPPHLSSLLTIACPPLPRLPYRVVFAVASLDSVLLYDTQQAPPFALLSNIHYTNITDLAW